MGTPATLVDQAVARAQGAVTFDDFADVVSTLELGMGASGSLLFSYDDDGLRMMGGSLLPALATYGEEHFKTDPIHPYLRGLGPRFLAKPTAPDFDPRAFERTLAYADFYRPSSAEQLLGIWPTDLRYSEPGMVGILLTRGRAQSYFSDDELRGLERVRRSLRAAVRRAQRFEKVSGELRVVESLLAARVSAVDLVWSRQGRLLWASRQAAARGAEARATLDVRARAWSRSLLRSTREPQLDGAVELGPSLFASFFVLSTVPGGPWICATLETTPSLRPVQRPSAGELRVLRLLAEGCTNPQIAERLGLSLETVRTHVKSLLRKLEVDNRTAAALRARDLGLLEHCARDPSE